MIYDQPEHFGIFEKRITAKEKEQVAQFLKYDRHVPLKFSEQVFQGEADAERFRKLGIVGGGFFSLAYFFLPVIRGLPIRSRLFWSAVPGSIVFVIGDAIREELSWNRTYSCYQKFQVLHSMHRKVFV